MKRFILLLFPIAIISCGPTKNLSKIIHKQKVSPEYLHNSEIKQCDRTVTIALSSINDSRFPRETTVNRIRRVIHPFLVYNNLEYTWSIDLGESSLDGGYGDFLEHAFKTESPRTGCYTVVDNPLEADYTLDITVNRCEVNAKYEMNSVVIFLLLAYSQSYEEMGLPAITNLMVNAKLKKGEETVLDEQYQMGMSLPFLSGNYANTNKLKADFLKYLVENLSANTKFIVEAMINDINQNISH